MSLIGSFSYLQVARIYITALISLNLGQILTLTTDLAVLGRLKKRGFHAFLVDIDPILFLF